MSLTVTHAFTSPVADDPAASAAGEVTPTRWNANHTITGTADITIGSSVITGGADKEILFNNAGVIGGDPNFTWDTSIGVTQVTGSLRLNGATPNISFYAAAIQGKNINGVVSFQNVGANSYCGIDFYDYANNYVLQIGYGNPSVGSSFYRNINFISSVNKDLVLLSGVSGSSEAIRIFANAQIGINSPTPQTGYILTVTGIVNNNTIALHSPNNASYAGVEFFDYLGNDIGGFFYGNPSVSSVNLRDIIGFSVANKDFVIFVGASGATEALRVTTGGQVNLPQTTNSSIGVLSLNNVPFVHNYPGSASGNVFFGGSGNFTTTGNGLMGMGVGALGANTTGTGNAAIGTNTLAANTTGIDNMGIGFNALYTNVAGSNNVGIGRTALYTNNGSNNLGIGAYSLYANTTGSQNVAVGTFALQTNTTHISNTGVGYGALLNSDAEGNVGIGERTGKDVTTGSYNTFIGSFAGWGITTGSNNVIIAPNTSFPAGTAGAIIFGDGAGSIWQDYNYTTASVWTFAAKIAVPGGANPILTSTSTITGGATGNVPTLTAGPVTGNPTKWIPINDAGVTRYIPTW